MFAKPRKRILKSLELWPSSIAMSFDGIPTGFPGATEPSCSILGDSFKSWKCHLRSWARLLLRYFFSRQDLEICLWIQLAKESALQTSGFFPLHMILTGFALSHHLSYWYCFDIALDWLVRYLVVLAIRFWSLPQQGHYSSRCNFHEDQMNPLHSLNRRRRATSCLTAVKTEKSSIGSHHHSQIN